MHDLEKKIFDIKKLKIEDRSFSDLINYTAKISKLINFYNRDNITKEKFYSMFSHDNSFLISEISKYDINELKFIRTKLIKRFDKNETYKEKIQTFTEFSIFTKSLFETINDWFKRSISKDFISDSSINFELESIIKKHASQLALKYNSIINFFSVNVNSENKLETIRFIDTIWLTKKDKLSTKVYSISKNRIVVIDNLFKNLLLINNSLIKILENIISRSRKKINTSLESKSHNPHIGLLFSFFKLYDYLVDDINKISKKHLNYYYCQILGQYKLESPPNKSFAVFKIDQNLEEIYINKGQKINCGQYKDGSIIKYSIDEDLILNNAKISSLMTVFLSNNSIYEFDSRFRLIKSIFSKVICSNSNEVEKFNKNSNVFNALGSDQNFISDDKTNMNYSDLGFIIGSSCLKLGKSKREILIEFVFNTSSIKHLSDLIIDISNNSRLNENEVFYKIFSDAFTIKYTCEDGWHSIKNFEIIMPEDWSKNSLSICLKLDKSSPSIQNFEQSIHELKLDAKVPLIHFTINQNSFYNAYGFLNKMKIVQLNIESKVSGLNELKVFRGGQNIPTSSEFDFFGPTPKNNSSTYIVCEELFNKKVNDFKLSWNYFNLQDIENNLDEYYKGYGKSFSPSKYKLKLSLLSDYSYLYIDESRFLFSMFDIDDKDNKILNNKSHSFQELNNTQISPNFNLNNGEINNFSNDHDSGIIRIELISPTYSFGHKLYPKVYADSVAKNINSNENNNSNEFINEPFSPQISDFTIDYRATTTMYFDEKNRSKNDFNEENTFFHISPFGIQNTFSKNELNSSMLYELNNEGEFIIGFSSSSKIKNLDLFFEIVKNENEFYDFSSKIQWMYATKNGWKSLGKQFILSDQTNNLINSGVISLLLPNDFSINKNILSGDEYFLKAVSKNKADQLGLIKSIYTNACAAVEVVPDNKELRLDRIKEKSFQSLEKNIPGVISVTQPISSSKISLFESDSEFYSRVSNLIKHKNRPVTKSDFEDFIRDNFNELSYVRCVGNNNNSLLFVCLKKIDSSQHIDEVKLSPTEIKNISKFLVQFISPNFNLGITNPIFEDLIIKASIKFKTINPGRAINILNQELLLFICPWKVSDSINYISKTINNIDILNFIKDRDYVEYVTGFSIIHFRKNESGIIDVYDSATENYENDFIKCGSARSIIVPRNRHIIKVIEDVEYELPEKVNFEDLEIEESFITVKQSKTHVNKITKKEEKVYNNLKFIFK